jgi:hypothetical protein
LIARLTFSPLALGHAAKYARKPVPWPQGALKVMTMGSIFEQLEQVVFVFFVLSAFDARRIHSFCILV